MTWTYTNSPSTSERDEVRFLVGDTDSSDQLVSDEEIAYALAQEGNARAAAALVAESIASIFGRKADKSVGDLKISYRGQSEHYMSIAKKLRSASTKFASPYAGGISDSDKNTVEDDSDRLRPSFERGLHDHKGVAYEDGDDICDD